MTVKDMQSMYSIAGDTIKIISVFTGNNTAMLTKARAKTIEESVLFPLRFRNFLQIRGDEIACEEFCFCSHYCLNN